MRENDPMVDSKGVEHMRGLAVGESVGACPRRLAVPNGDEDGTVRRRGDCRDFPLATKRLLQFVWIDRAGGWCPPRSRRRRGRRRGAGEGAVEGRTALPSSTCGFARDDHAGLGAGDDCKQNEGLMAVRFFLRRDGGPGWPQGGRQDQSSSWGDLPIRVAPWIQTLPDLKAEESPVRTASLAGAAAVAAWLPRGSPGLRPRALPRKRTLFTRCSSFSAGPPAGGYVCSGFRCALSLVGVFTWITFHLSAAPFACRLRRSVRSSSFTWLDWS